MTNKIKKYYLRFSDKNDYKKIIEFYDNHAHDSVRKRDSNVMRERINKGAVTIVEDDKGNMIAASIVYSHKITDKNGIERVKWQEFGSTRILKNGFPGFLDSLIAAQVLRAFLVEPPEDRFVSQMHYDSMQKKVSALGFRELKKVSPDLIRSKFNTVAAKDRKHASKDHWYHLGVEGMPVMAKKVVEILDKPYLENKRTGEKIQIDFSKTRIFAMFEADIRQLAKNNYGDVNNPDLKKSVAKHHSYWMYKTFK